MDEGNFQIFLKTKETCRKPSMNLKVIIEISHLILSLSIEISDIVTHFNT